MTQSHADTHDLDKLSRWHKDLIAETPGAFPVYAVFLVSGEDRDAHDVFRAFRTSFEEHGGGFQHLVIFGQHGVSVTTKSLLPELGLSDDSLPSLAMFTQRDAKSVHLLQLIEGDPDPSRPEESQPWRKVLNQVEEAVGGQGSGLDLSSVQGIVEKDTVDRPMVELVGKLLSELS